jgi:2-amino-4-hydroxy-6-hydroxymethyldihydropteridine diphosphokinase
VSCEYVSTSSRVALARIGLGSNVGDAAGHVERALAALAAIGTVTARSSLYRARAWGVREQADFVNAAALLETDLTPEQLLAALQQLEAGLGRVATYRWGPRVIDLDILAYDDLVVTLAHLVVPHPRLFERAFALVPLAEIDPSYVPARDRLGAEARAEVQRLDHPKDDGLSWHL